MQALSFRNTQFEVIDRNGQPWLRANQIGLSLAYKNPELSIAKLYRANASEFTEQMTALVDLPTAGGTQAVRIFSLRGAHLLGMFARTPVAKEFRHWVLDVLDREVGNPPRPLAPRRWLVSFDHNGKEQVTPVPDDACVLSHCDLIRAMVTPGELPVTTDELFEFIVAGLTLLKKGSDWQAQLLKQLHKR